MAPFAHYSKAPMVLSGMADESVPQRAPHAGKGTRMRVLIVDDHPVTRDGLRSALSMSDEVEVVGEATTGEEAIDLVEEITPDIVFMDVRMPGMGGLEATKAIRRSNPDTKVILFTVDESRAAIADAIRAGVSGYLLKDVGADELIQAARLALQGKAVIHPALTRAFIEEVQYVEQRPQTPLSRRESEILQKVAYGATTKEVARELGISPHTVKTHLERIFEKLGANDRAQAVAIALRQGLVD
jgi:two-component system, NarL family, response regulator DegU